MIENDIVEVVKEHYATPGASLLLMSELGVILTRRMLWPISAEKRSLMDIAENIDSLSVHRKDAFVAVVLKGNENLAITAIAEREERHFVRSLHRAILIAFTLRLQPGEAIGARVSRRISFETGPRLSEDVIPIEVDVRHPGVDIRDLAMLPIEKIKELERSIRTWCTRHNITPDSLLINRPKAITPTQTSVPLAPSHGNALERLYAAQDPEVARNLRVPIDIALALSRMA